VVAEKDGEVIGTMVLLIVPNLSHKALPWATIENMVVDENHQREGIGKLMIEYAFNRTKQAGCYKIQLSSTNSREEAHAFYQAMGFEPSAKGFRLYL